MDEMIFNPETHEYKLGDKVLISVTQLLKKHGLAPDYDAVDPAVLQAAADKGTMIHKEIEDFVKNGDIGITPEFELFRTVAGANNGFNWVSSEKKVYNDVAAGTVDLIGVDGITDERILADIKTTATVHTESVRWQLSLYQALMGEHFDMLLCIHLRPDKCELKEVAPIAPEEVKRLLQCEREGKIYTADLDIEKTLSETQLQNLTTLEQYIADLDEHKKAAEAEAEEMRNALIEAMEKRGIKKLELGSLIVTYVAPVTSSRVDTKRLKEDYPDIAAACMKQSTSKATLRIKVQK